MTIPHSMIPHTLVLLLLLPLGQACSDDGDAGVRDAAPDRARVPGTEGGACYPNMTCNAGLTCLSNLCVRVNDGGQRDKPGKPADLGPGKEQGPKPDSKAWPCTGTAQCDDKLACTEDKCEPAGCKNTLKSGFCLIAKACYSAGAKNPADACQVCGPTLSTVAWSQSMGSGCVSTLAGSGAPGFLDGAAATAQFNTPSGLARASSGMIYIADRKNHRIRTLNNWVVGTLAGTGVQGYKDGAAATAQFSEPYALALDSAGTLYVLERAGHRVRAISGGVVTTVAGSGLQGFANGAAAAAKFNFPTGVAAGAPGTVYVADRSNNRVRLVTGGQVTTFAGSGAPGALDGAMATAQFKSPSGLWLSGGSSMYVADATNNKIRLITAGKVSTLAGDGAAGLVNGAAASARFSGPVALVASAAKIYVTDQNNHAIRTVASGVVATLAGSGSQGFGDGALLKAKFNYPVGLVLDSKGQVYVADAANHRIRLITP